MLNDESLIAALRETGYVNTKAAAILQVSEATVRRHRQQLALRGHSPDHDMTHTVPDGFKIRGTSTLYDKDGNISQQWVKSSADDERRAELLREIVEAMADDLPRVSPTNRPGNLFKKLMACYPIGDAHIGMLAWQREVGEPWDLKIAERMQCEAMARLVALSPPCEQAVIINLGDWLHADNMEGVTTRSGHPLDMDSRYGKMASIGVKIMRQCIESALEKHGSVHVINVVGNHDDTSALMLSICLANVYENEPRVTIDETPGVFNYFRHGKTLVGCHHGHTAKAEKLPGVMAADRPKDWGDTDHRYWWTGHIHHQSLKDFAGVSVESFRTLAAKDAYSYSGGYRAPRDMKCIVLHDEHGEVARHTMNVGMLDGVACAA